MYITALRQSHASYFINITNRSIPPHLFAGPAKLKTFYSTRSFIFPRKGNSVSTLSQTNFFLSGKTVRLRKTKTGTPTVTQCYVSRKKTNLYGLAEKEYCICPWNRSLCPHAPTFSLTSFVYIHRRGGNSLWADK